MASAVRPPKFLPPAAVEQEKLRLAAALAHNSAAAKVCAEKRNACPGPSCCTWFTCSVHKQAAGEKAAAVAAEVAIAEAKLRAAEGARDESARACLRITPSNLLVHFVFFSA